MKSDIQSTEGSCFGNVACVQMVSSDSPIENFQRASNLLENAVRDASIDLLVFPENFLHFGSQPVEVCQTQLDSFVAHFRQAALRHSVNIVLGSVPIPSLEFPGRCYSRSYLVNKQGELQASYDKKHLFDVQVNDAHGQYRESDTFCPGSDLVVEAIDLSDAGCVGLGMSICYDLRFPEQYIALREQGADILVVPSAFTHKTGAAHWEILLRARAIENQCFVIAPNQGGEHSKGRQTWGHSMIIDPWGQVIGQCSEGEGVCSASLDFDQLRKVRNDMPLRAEAHGLAK